MTGAGFRRGCLGLAAAFLALLVPASAQAEFGMKSLATTVRERDGSLELKAGSHPFEYELDLAMNLDSEGNPEGTLRDLIVDLPPGLIGNPQAVPRCPAAEFEGQIGLCPGITQIGIARIDTGEGTENAVSPVFNLTPPVGVAARIGFSIVSLNSFQEGSLNPLTGYGLRVADITIPTTINIRSVKETIWGVPADPEHDAERQCIVEGKVVEGCSTDSPPLPFLSLPTSCEGVPQTTVSIDSLENPGAFVSESVPFLDENSEPAGFENCEALPFSPTIASQPETKAADSPTGLRFALHLPQHNEPQKKGSEGVATAHLKDASVALPAGLALNPSAADGLGACSLTGPEGINLPGSGEPLESQAAKCPASSKVGTVQVKTPLLDHPLPGAVYLAKQGENPFNSLIALYIAVEDPITGVIVKIPGKVEPDPQTGQLRATFKENPQLPFEDLELDFFGGPRASLTTPSTCGTYTTTSDLTPWSTPEGKDAFPSDSFAVSSGASGGSCPASEAQMPNDPSLQAGTMTPLAGSYSPVLFKLTREGGSQPIGSVNATLPPGLTGKLAGVAECSGAQIAQAASRNQPGQGALEKQSPSCPSSSEIGTVTVGAGSGSPIHVGGKAYLAGPYKGAPLSFAFITPAIAGPFDLGTVVVRAPAYVDPLTAQITVKSDPIPQLLAGIPLDIRSIAVNADRDRFTLNPTSCEPMAIGATAISTLGQSSLLSNRFQVGGCKGLDFEPKIALKLKGGTKRGAFPKLKATYTPRPEGEANLKGMVLRFPRSEFVEQGHFRTICTRVQFAANQCPNASIYGHVKAITPLLEKPLEGPVYLRSSNHNLPDVVFVLHGQVDAQVSLRIDSVKGGLRASLEDAPDVPLSKVVLDMQGGQKGLLVNSRDTCAKTYRATAQLAAHSGRRFEVRPVVKSDCGKRGKKRR